MSELYKLDYESPIGVIEISGTNDAISSIMFAERDIKINIMQEQTPQVLAECFSQLDEYFKGERREFTFPIYLKGPSSKKTYGTH